MAHINAKPFDRNATFPDAESAILHVVAHGMTSQKWDFGGAAFGRTIDQRRAIDAAIKAKKLDAFTALQRKGYWRVELAM
jgi:hypothetical protein